jgi:hypothetical protein
MGHRPIILFHHYNYQPELTKKLDSLCADELNREMLYEIVLWKLNRFPWFDCSLLEKLKSVKQIKAGDHREVGSTHTEMLRCPGVALPMASTILRFINRDTFQIIDDRVYRIVHPGKAKYPNKPTKLNALYLDNSAKIYFDYLDELRKLCGPTLPFAKADRILYQLDIEIGNQIGDKA